jgi:hypothetical protein
MVLLLHRAFFIVDFLFIHLLLKLNFMKKLLIAFVIVCAGHVSAQDKSLPYYEIPAQPDVFTAGNVASRLVDGLGFRYYWATEGLRPEDLSFKPSAEARTSEETLAHIYGLSTIIINSTTNTVNLSDGEKVKEKLPFGEMRKRTLENLKTASDNLRKLNDKQMGELKIIFKRDGGAPNAEYPFWNQINGPIADCLWHVGQVVTFRRSTGNPFTEKVSVFSGTVRK